MSHIGEPPRTEAPRRREDRTSGIRGFALGIALGIAFWLIVAFLMLSGTCC